MHALPRALAGDMQAWKTPNQARQGKAKMWGWVEMELRLIIAGSRYFEDYEKLEYVASRLLATRFPGRGVVVVSGGCCGADLLGERFAAVRGFSVRRFSADWAVFGRAAGPLRNRRMVAFADAVLVFPVPGRACRGTRDLVRAAQLAGLPVFAAS